MSYSDFGKLENGRLVQAPKYLKDGDVGILYPSDETLLRLGYKPFKYNYPENETEGYHWVARGWEETQSEIRQNWELAKDPVPSDEDEIDPWDAAGIILGGGIQ
jgi:hypothetical protein